MADSERNLIARIVLEGVEKFKAGMEEVNKQSQETEKTFKNLQKVTTPLGVAMTAVGAAGLKLVDSALKMNAQLATTAITIGTTTDELRNMALETTNVTFGLQSVIDTFDVLARSGVSKNEIEAAANAFDALADATGYSAEQVAEMLIPAFKNLGVAIPTTSSELDAFTYLVKNSMVSLEDFAAAMDYAAVYGGDLNLTIEEMVAIMAALEDKGITGSAVTRLFRRAVSEAAAGTATLTEALGLTQEEIDAFKVKLSDAAGITDEYADAANQQYGIMDKLKQEWSELTLRIGTFLEPMQGILVAFTALGAALIALPIMIPKVIAAVRGLSVALRTLSIAGGALGIIGIVATLGTAIYSLSGKTRDYTASVDGWNDSLDTAKERLKALEDSGEGASEQAGVLRQEIGYLTDALEEFSDLSKTNEVTTSQVNEALEKRNKLLSEQEGLRVLKKITDEALSFKDAMKLIEEQTQETQDYLAGFYYTTGTEDFWPGHDEIIIDAEAVTAALADVSQSVIELSTNTESAIANMSLDELSEAYLDAADNAEILLAIQTELATRMQETAETTYNEAIEALEDYYGIAEEEEKSLLEMYEEEVSARQKSLNDQLRAVRDNTNDVIAQYQREYNAKVKILNDETDATVKALQDQLDALDDADKADQEAREDRAFEERKAELERTAAEGWSRQIRADAQAELDDLLEERAQTLADHERQAQRESLQQQIEDVQDAASEKQAQYQEELDANIETQNAILAASELTIQSELDSLENAVEIKKGLLQQELADAIAAQDAILAATQSRIAGEVAAQIAAWDALSSGDTEAASNIATGLNLISVGDKMAAFAAQINALAASASTSNLPGFATGTDILEPTLLYGLKSRRPLGVAAEYGQVEHVGPGPLAAAGGGGGITVQVNVNGGVYRDEMDRKSLARDIARDVGNELYRIKQQEGRSYGG